MSALPEVVLGTSGFSFDDWVGPFYPAGTLRADMLALYAERFTAVEVNATYYRIPPPSTMAGRVGSKTSCKSTAWVQTGMKFHRFSTQ